MGEFNEARLDDLIRSAEKGNITCSPYLTPREQIETKQELTVRGFADRAKFYGGYETAERRRLFLFPEWIPLEDDRDNPAFYTDEKKIANAVTAIKIVGSGYRELSHRDYLGSLLGLGIERDSVGDIALQNNCSAVVFTTGEIAKFLCENMEKVANDKVRCTLYTPDESFTDGRKTVTVTDTVASARLDCIVASLSGKSRETARQTIESGLVEVDYLPETRADKNLMPPVTISVRGTGKFRLIAFEGETKKGRLRLKAEKFV